MGLPRFVKSELTFCKVELGLDQIIHFRTVVSGLPRGTILQYSKTIPFVSEKVLF
jgi:hypothetical protein